MTPARSAVLSASHQKREPSAVAGFLREVGDFFRQFIVSAFNPYRPEQHYMRGPGPACRARQSSSS
jgi:hypothetical protein